jgi:hypothetical protein
MSLREGAPYADALDEVTGMLTYEGHDEPQRLSALFGSGRSAAERLFASAFCASFQMPMQLARSLYA